MDDFLEKMANKLFTIKRYTFIDNFVSALIGIVIGAVVITIKILTT